MGGFIHCFKRGFEYASHPKRPQRRKEERAERQRQELRQQAQKAQEAARLQLEKELELLKQTTAKLREQIEQWYATELAIVNEDYAQQYALYQADVNNTTINFEQESSQLKASLTQQQLEIIENSDYSDDEVFVAKCNEILTQLYNEPQSGSLNTNTDVASLLLLVDDFNQKMQQLESGYNLMVQQLTAQWEIYEKQHQEILEELKRSRDEQLKYVDELEQDQIVEIEAAYQAYKKEIDDTLAENLKIIDESLAAQLRQMKQSARMLIVSSLLIIVSAVVVIYAPVLFAGLGQALINGIRASFALTGLGSIDALINNKGTLGIGGSHNFAPPPKNRPYTPPQNSYKPVGQPYNYGYDNLNYDSINDFTKNSRLTPSLPKQDFNRFHPARVYQNPNDSIPSYTIPVQPTNYNPIRHANPAQVNQLQQFLIGSGRGFVNLGQGIKQASLAGAQKLGLVDAKVLEDYTKAISQETALYNRTPAANSTTSKVGMYGTEALIYSIVPAGAGLRTYKLAAAGGISSGVIGALQPVYEGSSSRAANAVTSAAMGATIAPAVGMLYQPTKKGMLSLYQRVVNKPGNGVSKNTHLDIEAQSAYQNLNELAVHYSENKLSGKLNLEQIEFKLNPDKLLRTHAISGKNSANKIKNLEKNMRSNGFDINKPIEVVAYNDRFYILDGQHRYRAAIMAGINEIPVKIITDIKNHPSSWATIEEIIEAAAQCGHDHIKFKY